jgi:acetyl esterase/lipase
VPPQPLTVDGAAAHVYKSVAGVDLRLHVFGAGGSAAALKPAIVFFFGGGWVGGSIGQFAPQARHFADRGMVAVVADYRVRNRHQTSPFEAMADAKSAIRWVRAHAPALGVDPDRIVASGGSAGGHIALSAAVFDAFDDAGEDRKVSSKPNALVLFNPAVDTASEAFLARFDNRGREGSPLHHLGAELPPTLIMHGTADTTVPYGDVEAFCKQASARMLPCALVGYEGATHGFFNPQNADGKWYRETLAEADRFLTRLGYVTAR